MLTRQDQPEPIYNYIGKQNLKGYRNFFDFLRIFSAVGEQEAGRIAVIFVCLAIFHTFSEGNSH